MFRDKLVKLLICCSLMACAAAARAGIPDYGNCYVENFAPETVSCVVCPQGDGSTLSECYVYGSGPVQYPAIKLTLLDINLDPVVNFPAEDMYLATTGPAPVMVTCPGGAIADSNTDPNGETTFGNPLFAGCCSTNGLFVYVNGHVINGSPLDILINSPDLNCDLVVNLSDVVIFVGVYFGPYDYCADFYWDGALTLPDVVILAPHMMHLCP